MVYNDFDFQNKSNIKVIHSSAERDQLNVFETLNPVTDLTTQEGFSYS